MTDTTQKQLPEPIRHAMAALEILRVEDAGLAMQLEKVLPSYALRLSHRGDRVSVEDLLHTARQGVVALKSAFAKPQTTPQSLLEHYQDLFVTPPEVQQEQAPLIVAVMRGDHQEVIRLLDAGADIHVDHGYALHWAAENGQTETVRLLLDRGATLDGTMLVASRNGHTETVRLLLDRGADIDAHDGLALCSAARAGDTESVRLLLDHGADIHANNDQALRHAAGFDKTETACLLLDRGANPAVLWCGQKTAIKVYRQDVARWQRTARIAPPQYLEGCDATVFKPALFSVLVSILNMEDYPHKSVAHPMAYAAMALLQNETRVLHYLQKWGTPGKQPLHDLIHTIQLPTDLSGINLAAWGDAVLQHGPKMAQLVKFCDRMPVPVRSPDDKRWSYTRTRTEFAKFAYKRGAEDLELAALCFQHLVTESNFNTALNLVKKMPSQQKNMPEIMIDGARFDMEGATFKKLANNDVRGLFLGELTNCCQSIGSTGEECAKHGFSSENGGFYVVETVQGEIIGQSWAWRGEQGELCLDSLETLGTRVSNEHWKALLDETARELTTRQDHNVTALHVGMGGKTPRSLSQYFTSQAAKPVDYKGYRDSKTQIRVWKS